MQRSEGERSDHLVSRLAIAMLGRLIDSWVMPAAWLELVPYKMSRCRSPRPLRPQGGPETLASVLRDIGFALSRSKSIAHRTRRSRGSIQTMRTLSQSLKTFLDDLADAKLEDRVLVLCFNEFGRQLKENASGGTDRGTAGPVMLSGSAVSGILLAKRRPIDETDPQRARVHRLSPRLHNCGRGLARYSLRQAPRQPIRSAETAVEICLDSDVHGEASYRLDNPCHGHTSAAAEFGVVESSTRPYSNILL